MFNDVWQGLWLFTTSWPELMRYSDQAWSGDIRGLGQDSRAYTGETGHDRTTARSLQGQEMPRTEDPVDVIELGSRQRPVGSITAVKTPVLASWDVEIIHDLSKAICYIMLNIDMYWYVLTGSLSDYLFKSSQGGRVLSRSERKWLWCNRINGLDFGGFVLKTWNHVFVSGPCFFALFTWVLDR